MTKSSKEFSLNKFQSIILFIACLLLATFLFFTRTTFNSKAPLDELARSSLSPENALGNGLPTVFEFYADWCEVCQKMAPSILSAEKKYDQKIDVVLINIDNPKWEDLLDLYSVKGIPQLNFFDANGMPIGKSIGLRKENQIFDLFESVINNKSLPKFSGVGDTSIRRNVDSAEIVETNSKTSPRSHT